MTHPVPTPVPAGTALVLAGGGVAGIAWELGVLRGIADADPALAGRLLAADLVVGTSAGSSVAAQITSGVDLDELYEAQLRRETAEIEVDVDLLALFAEMGEVMAGAADAADAGRRMGALALAAPTVDPARRAAIAARLPVPDWPDRRVLLPAVDTGSGEVAVFTRDSGVALVDAVAASCAVPGVWPPVAIGGRRYMDGGTRSMTNADLAAGAERVLVVVPALADAPQLWGRSLADEIADLAPAAVAVVHADQASVEAFGSNALSPATRAAAARAGRAVGAAAAARVAATLG
ncbi:patatin-like phospholipase family protein [Modestobacter excelsi]|uniref:patatin-like phospholipase family protein n=1 Tax=Modestobacter excelsi TaxID=2213161 RepID=UPI00110C9AB2|nr:patatin-like phospholipase family protein [Modestobacter excelsi]